MSNGLCMKGWLIMRQAERLNADFKRLFLIQIDDICSTKFGMIGLTLCNLNADAGSANHHPPNHAHEQDGG